MEELKTQDTEELKTDEQVEDVTDDNNDEQAKLYTQEEVDKIVKKRLGRERNKFEKTKNKLINESEFSSDLIEREKAVTLKEMKFEYALKVQDEGLPLELVDYIDYSDPENANNSYNGIVGLFKEKLNKAVEVRVKEQLRGSTPKRMSSSYNPVDSRISEIFKKK